MRESGNRAIARERITLLVGRNAAPRLARLRRLIEGWVDEEWSDFNFSEAEAREAPPAQLLMNLSQIAVGDPEKHRVLALRGVDRLRPNEAEALAGILPRIPAHARLILVAEGDRSGRDTKLSSKLLKAVEAEGQVIDFPPLRSGEVPSFLAGRVTELGLRLAPDASRALITRIGADGTVLERELEKLRSATAPGETITAALVEELVAPSAEHSIFELTDAVGERNALKAREAMEALLSSGEAVYMLLPMIARQIRLVWVTKAASERIEGAALKDPGIAKLGDWQKEKLRRQAQVFKWPALEEGMRALYETDLAIKGIEESGDDPRALMDALLLRLCGSG